MTVCIPVNSKHLKKKNFSNPTDSAWVASILRMTYDSLSHPMLRQSSPKNTTCHFNSSQKTIAERYALTQYFKNTRLYLRTSNILISSTLSVDQFISKTIILLRISHYCTEKCDLSFQLTYHMISVHDQLFLKTFHYGGNQYVSVIYCTEKYDINLHIT